MMMEILILALILTASYNASRAIMGRQMRWSVALYWFLVGTYWMYKAMEV